MFVPIGGDNAFFLDLYARYRRDPSSVPIDWAVFVETTLNEPRPDGIPAGHLALLLRDVYRQYGHLEASLDPLGISPRAKVPMLERLRSDVAAATSDGFEIELGGAPRSLPPADLERTLSQIYAGHLGVEAAHLIDEEQREWLYGAVETAFLAPAEPELLGRTLESVAFADEFEAFCRLKFPTKKRFGLEGADTAIAFLRELLRAAAFESDEVVIGGMHRGRLALLATVLGKPLAALFGELHGRDFSDGSITFTGDVPYHLGYSGELVRDGRGVRIRLLPHPSHLAVVAPVAVGATRATQDAAGTGPARTLSVLLHTDAAFSGQGLISEVMQLSGLEGYSVGGTIHLVVNNQIGFTTLPSEGRSSHYCTDIGKSVGVPILHVNADDALAVARVAQIAAGWRRQFARDILIDLVCYRRYGHNELDEPRFTQPATWSAIESHPPVRARFAAEVRTVSPESEAQAEAAADAFREELRKSYETSADFRGNSRIDQGAAWEAIGLAGEDTIVADETATGLDLDQLRRLGHEASVFAPDVEPHWKVRRFYEARLASIDSGEGVNFATAEALAFASLIAAGSPVRMSGQDTVRGTFTQRHIKVHGAGGTGAVVPLAAVSSAGTRLDVINSPLSEYGVLGFEYGYSLIDPNRLTLWETQFGDFLNGAQVMVDQFIVSAEAKWGLRSGLVVLLPHGLEGQGPDHSSARIERLLQLCAGGNIIVANPSTPANLFHLLRRQILAPWRKPLFVIAPKSLLRAKAAVSPLEAFGPGTRFEPLIGEAGSPKARRVILCSGKIYYDLVEARAAAGLQEEVVLARLEQLYPFPRKALGALVAAHPCAGWVWCQEEPMNQGAWAFVQRDAAKLPLIGYAGRPAMPVSAAGSVERHEVEQRALINAALDLDHHPMADGAEPEKS